MTPFFKIMIPVDFSPVLDKAFEFLEILKDKAEIEIHLVHVLESETFSPQNLTNTSSENIPSGVKFLWEQAFYKMELLSQLRPVVSSILLGKLSESLTYYAVDQGIDLIVMGTKKKKDWLERVEGSTASQLIKIARLPVISIHQKALVSPIQHIAWVADFPSEEQANRSIAFIKKLQRLFNAKLHLLQIVEKEEAYVQEIRSGMHYFAKSYQLENFEIHLHRHENVPDGVGSFNKEANMNIVAIGTHSPKALNFLYKSRVPDALMDQCIRPLLTCYLD